MSHIARTAVHRTTLAVRLQWPLIRSRFSTSARRPLMELTGFTEEQLTVRDAISAITSKFPNTYWQECDQNERDPKEFHAALAKDGWLGIALPEHLGGAGLGISEATMMMQTITQSGAGMAGAQAIHANVYATQPLAKFGTKEQLEETIPKIINGTWRTCFGVTEPNTGLETLKLKTTATKNASGDSYSVTGQKIWITCAQVASKMILLARTTPIEEIKRSTHGLSMFCIDLDRDKPGLDMRKIKKMGGRAVDANEVFFDNYQIPTNTLVGEENEGFKIILHGMNAERCLLAGEALGLGYAALERATQYANDRVVFGRPIGQNQGIAHPLADAYMKLEAAKLMTYHAARLYDASRTDSSIPFHSVGVACNSAKYLAAEAAFTACERAVLTHGGMGYAMEYDVERYLRECLVPRIAPAFQLHHVATPRDPTIDAIPGGAMQDTAGEKTIEPGTRSPCGTETRRRTLRPMSSSPTLTDLRSLLPLYEASELLVDTYFDRVHWFMLIFQQDDFRQNWPHLYETQSDGPNEVCNDLGFLSTFLMVIAIGAHYTGPYRQRLLARYKVEPEALKQRILKAIKSSLLDIISVGSLEVVQTCVLLGTYYLFHGAPRLAWPVCGCGLRVAQSLNLHRKKEHATLPLTPAERNQNETRKRCWWAIYEIEAFCSMSYGYPHSIGDADCDVEPLNPSAKLRNAPSPVSFDEPLRCETTLLAYKYYMSKLSVLTKSVLSELYGFGPGLVNNNKAPGESGSRLRAVVIRVAKLDARLRDWRAEIPPKLRWETVASTSVSYSSLEEFDRDIGASGVRFDNHIYHLQALALELAYENTMILVHRPLLSFKLVTKSTDKRDDMSYFDIQENPFLKSMKACHDAGMSLSELANSPILELVSETYAAAFVSIHTFTAGVALGILGSIEPLTPQAQEAKVGLHRLMSIQAKLQTRSVLATQGLDILQRLTKLVLDKELSMMLDVSKPIRWPEQHSGVEGDVGALQTSTLSPKPSSSDQRTRTLPHDAAGAIMPTDAPLTMSDSRDTQETESQKAAPDRNSLGNFTHLQYIEDASVSEALHDFDQVLSTYVNSSWADPDQLVTDTSHVRTLDDEGSSMLEQTWIWGPDTLPRYD
ncbi:hypothetical protein KXW32_008088 [Aspergillus fumigatus]|nr:hypothetical protein KXV90_007190 [Aspergillus fumigatus]KAH2078071.1 hypothetical protein KXW32_008088 [Aspergillus fumigatus]KAH2581405.1 hypothetical protein KXV99_000679 [Aspergillus fumigatus]KAH3328667.1 hypothetical protein KXW13_000445 [Aspergillus fumigatus]KAH3340056.1 hypothetical protein KXW81_007322 [Aspergillus fumigatus]